jgi:hypothetical protein
MTDRLRTRNAQKKKPKLKGILRSTPIYKDREDSFWSNRNTFLARGAIQKASDERIAKLEARVKTFVDTTKPASRHSRRISRL